MQLYSKRRFREKTSPDFLLYINTLWVKFCCIVSFGKCLSYQESIAKIIILRNNISGNLLIWRISIFQQKNIFVNLSPQHKKRFLGKVLIVCRTILVEKLPASLKYALRIAFEKTKGLKKCAVIHYYVIACDFSFCFNMSYIYNYSAHWINYWSCPNDLLIKRKSLYLH